MIMLYKFLYYLTAGLFQSDTNLFHGGSKVGLYGLARSIVEKSWDGRSIQEGPSFTSSI